MSNYYLDNSGPFAVAYSYAGFPSTITPAFWLDGRQQAYSDSGGTVPVFAFNGQALKVNQTAALSGSLQSSSTALAPIVETNAFNFQGDARAYLSCADCGSLPHASDASNTTYFIDGIHPTIALNADMTTVYQTAVQAAV